jgi:Protein of unknown function (DUF3072)
MIGIQAPNWVALGAPFAALMFSSQGSGAEAHGLQARAIQMSGKVPDSDAIKDPAEWTTGEEPMTGAQDSYLHTLARKAGVEVVGEMSKAEASIKTKELREKTGLEKPTRKGRN